MSAKTAKFLAAVITARKSVLARLFNSTSMLFLLLLLPAEIQAQFIYETNNGTITITGYSGSGGEVTIPSTVNGLPVTSISHQAFYDKWSLTSLTIPSNVASIGTFAFAGCANLTAFAVDPLNPTYSTADGVLLNKSQTTLVAYPGGRSGSYAIPYTVNTIKNAAFAGSFASPSAVVNVTIPDSITCIEASAFSSSRLTSVTIPSSITNIGISAFYLCYSLADVTIQGGVTDIGEGMFMYCGSLTNVTLPNSVTNLGKSAFSYCGSLTNLRVPGSINTIAERSFEGCFGLTGITLGDGITSIGNNAFSSCSNLASITIPNSVKSIGARAFLYCTNLAGATIGRGVTAIGDFAFAVCASLRAVRFQGDAPEIGLRIFTNVNNSAISTIYYLPGTIGWSSTFGDRPTEQWVLPNPLILNFDPSFGVKTNLFGFRVSWATNVPVVVEACANLATHDWTPLSTNALAPAGWFQFSDPEWTNYPSRLYRVRRL